MSSEHDESASSPAPAPSGLPDEASAPVDRSARARSPFAIVGVGASAGGIEALKAFFAAAAADSGMAYVVIQHLSPEHQSLMADILGRCTALPVVQIEDGMRVEPNHVYVIRSGYTVTLKDGRLNLGQPVEKRGHRRPVDDFSSCLAIGPWALATQRPLHSASVGVRAVSVIPDFGASSSDSSPLRVARAQRAVCDVRSCLAFAAPAALLTSFLSSGGGSTASSPSDLSHSSRHHPWLWYRYAFSSSSICSAAAVSTVAASPSKAFAH